ncbi:MAG: aminoacyl-tRNA hydrolase [Oscillospiraceae bacterium]|jgi:PTH1 family peptidyl-tRNA hydrolase|nr:aminoacyl-tRNA hydrolase [Oscillospiraceae bacterium]
MFFVKKSSAVSWIAVFLGNPGARYASTRHNAGFMAADALAKRAGIKIDRLKFKSLTNLTTLGGERVFLMKPQTFMNLSGDAVRAVMSFYKLPPERIIAVSDDIALPLGKLRVKRDGSAGGHNGLKDIILKCGGEGFPRVKIGVGAPPHPEMDAADWVLAGLRGQELETLTQAAARAVEAAESIIAEGPDRAMNRFN